MWPVAKEISHVLLLLNVSPPPAKCHVISCSLLSALPPLVETFLRTKDLCFGWPGTSETIPRTSQSRSRTYVYPHTFLVVWVILVSQRERNLVQFGPFIAYIDKGSFSMPESEPILQSWQNQLSLWFGRDLCTYDMAMDSYIKPIIFWQILSLSTMARNIGNLVPARAH